MKVQIDSESKEKFIQGGFSEGVGYDESRNAPDESFVIPDEELKAQILSALHDDTHVVGSNITVNVSYGEVTLQGTLLSRDMLNAAKECAGIVNGVKKVIDELVISVE